MCAGGFVAQGGGTQILVLYTCVTRSFQNIPFRIKICSFEEKYPLTRIFLQFCTSFYPLNKIFGGNTFGGIEEFEKWSLNTH